MNKSIEALLRGYIYFRVNGQGFWTYNAANAVTEAARGDVSFVGLHVWKGWRGFYYRRKSIIMTGPCEITVEDSKSKRKIYP